MTARQFGGGRVGMFAFLFRSVTTSATSSSSPSSILSGYMTKELWILRHGQATHNPRAEKAREEGCSWEEFLDLMRQDDSLDAELTDHGQQQARSVQSTYESHLSDVELVVSSPLSRAIQTADLAAPWVSKRVAYEGFREINGLLLNAKRRTRTELSLRFPHWELDHINSEHDDSWTTELEERSACGERGYRGLQWLLEHRREHRVLLVAHGGLLRFVMTEHPFVQVRDGRSNGNRRSSDANCNSEDLSSEDSMDASTVSTRPPHARFANCELRRYLIQWDDKIVHGGSQDNVCPRSTSRGIVLTELDIV